MSKAWKPLGDGQYDSQHRINTIIVEGEWLKISELTLPMREIVEAELALPHDIRLCQLVDVDTPQPMTLTNSQLKIAIDALEHFKQSKAHLEHLDNGMHQWVLHTEERAAIDEVIAALSWLDGLAKE